MVRIGRAALAGSLVGWIALSSQAQTIAMYGEYGETNGVLLDLPQNPPALPCVPPPLTAARLAAIPPHLTVGGAKSFQHLDLRPTGIHDARCHDREQHIAFFTSAKGVFKKARVGVRGARNIAAAGVGVGLAVGDPFTIPPFAFQQNLGRQVGVVQNFVVRQIDTTFIAAMPGIDRNGPNPGPISQGKGSYTIKTAAQLAPVPALTRMFSQMNWQNPGNGQNNGKAVGFAQRLAADTTLRNTQYGGNEKVRVRYVAGPRQFGGTMALLLDGAGRQYLVPNLGSSGMIPALFKPAAATWPLPGDTAPGFRRRNAAGWDLTAPDAQRAGRYKGFNGHVATPNGAPIIAPLCTQTADPFDLRPAGCNEVNGFDTYMSGVAPLPPGGTFALVPKATSVKHMFALTTGTVSIVRVALRNGVHFSDTISAMGYDTLGVSAMGGPQRNVGLVAGAYTIRNSLDTQINAQMLGLNLKFTPEPAGTAALASGLGLLASLAGRRRASA